MHLTPMLENNCLELPQMPNYYWCRKNEEHLNIDSNFDHQITVIVTVTVIVTFTVIVTVTLIVTVLLKVKSERSLNLVIEVL